MSALLSAQALCVGHAGHAILPAVDVTIGSSELWVVTGPNGSGKTTWIKTLLGLLLPISGSVRHERPGLRLAYRAQRHELESHYPVAVKDVVAMGTLREQGWFSGQARRRRRVANALRLTGAAELAERPFSELSEGQKQRVLLARAIASAPSLVFLDEPTSAMDPVAEAEALTILDGLRAEAGTAVVLVSHHLDAALAAADKALFLDAEHGVVACGAVASVLADPHFARHFGGLVDAPDSACGDHRHG